MAVILVHSPLVGPLTWQAVATELTALGHGVVVPDARAAFASGPPYQTSFAQTVATQYLSSSSSGDGRTLVGHSAAGPLLPAIARLLAERHIQVGSLVYVDAALPHPGRPPLTRQSEEIAAHLRSLVHQGMLPPWPEWFPPGALEEILPDPSLRSAFVAELGPVPYGYYTEPAPSDIWQGPFSYLLLSERYRVHAEAAGRSGATVAELIDHHLAMLTAPAAVATALDRLVTPK